MEKSPREFFSSRGSSFVYAYPWVIGQNVLMANPSHQTFYPLYANHAKQLHHPR